MTIRGADGSRAGENSMRMRVFMAAWLTLAGCSDLSAPADSDTAGLPAIRAAIVARNYGEAADLARKLVKRTPSDAAAQFELARAEALLGNGGAALDALELAVRNGLPNVAGALADPAFDTLRQDARFASIEGIADPGRRPVKRIAAGEGRDQVSITTDADGRDTIRAGDVTLDGDF